ncbi:MAG: alkyl hydroperoxide reductase/Thiol specific antioxidant/Mal allergen [Schlesneria sp.]|nr:alkyl hydroperoxide reductase/Thiol specific antioxidant/Mal allergen [Schlesneria sp.]
MVRWLPFLICFAGQLAWSAEEAPSATNPENGIKPGHSLHGEAFDEGPRRAAYLMGTTGNVSFPITSKHPQAQAFFNQGIGQLHGFWYFEAERSFRQVCLLDHDCAMAYWGMALANVNNDKRAKLFIADAVKRTGSVTEREKMYIDALDAWYKAETGDEKKRKSRAQNYVTALENIVHKFPDDVEARAMLGLFLWQNRSDLSIASYFAIDALMNNTLAINPLHPVHHYRVHLWDNDKASQAVNSAENCGRSAPGIAHMWHMSGHTYSDLKQYFDAAWHQEASARTDHAYMMRDVIFPDAIHNFAHNNEWLVRDLQNVGRAKDAIALSRNAIELPRHPKYNTFPAGGKSAHYGRLRLYESYTQFEMWDALIADAQTQYLGPVEDHTELVKRLRLLGRAYFRKGDVEHGQAQLAALERRLKRVNQDRTEAVDVAVAKARFEGKDAKAVEAAENQAKQPTNEKIRLLERAVDELQGYVLLHNGKPAEALDRLKKAAGLSDEYLAEIEFQAGKKDEALKTLQKLVDNNKNEVLPLTALTLMQWHQGKKDEAKQTLEKLRDISGAIDIDVAPFIRLTPIAAELGFTADWRKARPVAKNAADLPPLAVLGPLHWSPSPAKDWALPDVTGKLHTLAQHRGRPVVVVFYLGHGCLHCAEQLQAFAPKTAEFEQAGISLVAISTDNPTDLKKSHESYQKDGTFPFPLVSDDAFVAFKQYHVFDDFENVPLHATFLIDELGRIRWHDIGAEPFMDVNFVLKESKRLLFPNQIQEVPEPPILNEDVPADALDPRNVFPAPSVPTPKPSVMGG